MDLILKHRQTCKHLNTLFEYHSYLPYIESYHRHISRIDVVWDVYHPSSLKRETQNKRGKGTRRCVEHSNLVPKNWQCFLRIDELSCKESCRHCHQPRIYLLVWYLCMPSMCSMQSSCLFLKKRHCNHNPVSAWNIGKAIQLLSSRVLAISCAWNMSITSFRCQKHARRIAGGTVSAKGLNWNVLLYVIVEDNVVTKHASI